MVAPPARRPARRRGCRGAVALEFALVLPLFLMLIAMIFAFGQAMWARSQMLNFISSTARSCSLRLPVNEGVINACVTDQMNRFRAAAGSMGGCQLGSPTFNVSQDSTGRDDRYQPNVCFVTLKLSCKLAWIPFAGILQAGSQNGMTVGVRASFPYLPNSGNGLVVNNGC